MTDPKELKRKADEAIADFARLYETLENSSERWYQTDAKAAGWHARDMAGLLPRLPAELDRVRAELADLQANGPIVQRGITGTKQPWMGTMREAWNDALDCARAEACLGDDARAELKQVRAERDALKVQIDSLPIVPWNGGWAIRPEHAVADAFWNYWRANGETHRHGYYESTWGSINRALEVARATREEKP